MPFTGCMDENTRQRIHTRQTSSMPSATLQALVKSSVTVIWPSPYFFLPRANSALGKALLSAREIALGKDLFAVTLFAVSCLPSIIGPLPSARALGEPPVYGQLCVNKELLYRQRERALLPSYLYASFRLNHLFKVGFGVSRTVGDETLRELNLISYKYVLPLSTLNLTACLCSTWALFFKQTVI